MATAAADGQTVSAPLTDYERQRLQNVQRNEAMLSALRIHRYEPEVIRRSLRAQGLSPDGVELGSVEDSPSPRFEIIQKRRARAAGRKKRFRKKGFRKKGFLSVAQRRLLQYAHLWSSKEPLSLESVYLPTRKRASASRFLERLQSLADEIPLSDLSARNGSSKRARNSEVEPSAFTLRRQDIAKVVPDRILSVAFLPLRDRLVLAAGDRTGHLGLWDVDCESSEHDFIHIYQPHVSPISGLSIAPFTTTRVVTCGYDGAVRQLNVESSQFDVLYSTDNQFSAISFVPDSAHCAFVAEANGGLKMLDTRDGKRNSEYTLHEKTINTIDFNAHATSVMATSSSDGTACVWDVRKLTNASSSLVKVEHTGAVHSAYFSPSGNLLATCSHDHTIKLLRGLQKDGSLVFEYKHQNPSTIDHFNFTNGCISTFRAIWGWDDEHVYVANQTRAIDVISTSLNATCCSLSSRFMTCIPCRLASHPVHPGVLAGSAAGGQLYVWRP